MHAEDLASHDGGNRERVEGVDKSLPNFDITSSFTFIVETINSGNVGAFVISSQEEEVFREFELVAEK